MTSSAGGRPAFEAGARNTLSRALDGHHGRVCVMAMREELKNSVFANAGRRGAVSARDGIFRVMRDPDLVAVLVFTAIGLLATLLLLWRT
jgi:hypothetical protein